MFVWGLWEFLKLSTTGQVMLMQKIQIKYYSAVSTYFCFPDVSNLISMNDAVTTDYTGTN